MLARRELLQYGAALVGLRACPQMSASRAPSLFPLPSSLSYTKGNYKVTLGKPRDVVISAGTSDFAWFAGMHWTPTGEILLRWSYNNDGLNNGQTRARISTDGGNTFPAGTEYTNVGKPSPLEPLAPDGTDLVGIEFWQWAWNAGDHKSVNCGYIRISNHGATYGYTPNGGVVSGFPVALSEITPGIPFITATDRIIVRSATEWYTTVQVVVVGENQVWGAALKSTDKGRNWTWQGWLNNHTLGNEGFSESSSWLDGSRWTVVSRTGISLIARSYSDDWGPTWTPSPATMSTGPLFQRDLGIGAWCKSPDHKKLSSGDWALTTGFARQALLDDGQARAHMGLYVGADFLSNNWEAFDLWDHHNVMFDASLQFDEVKNVTTGYTSFLELSSTATVSNILISYDQAGGSYGTGTTRANRIFVVNARIERLS